MCFSEKSVAREISAPLLLFCFSVPTCARLPCSCWRGSDLWGYAIRESLGNLLPKLNLYQYVATPPFLRLVGSVGLGSPSFCVVFFPSLSPLRLENSVQRGLWQIQHIWWNTRDSITSGSAAPIRGCRCSGYLEVNAAWRLGWSWLHGQDLWPETCTHEQRASCNPEHVRGGSIPTGRDYCYSLYINVFLCVYSSPSANQFLLGFFYGPNRWLQSKCHKWTN